MKITHVAIQGFKSFTNDQVLRVPARSDAFVHVTGKNEVEPDLGANGAGKSTLFDAIMWCLFGWTARGARAAAVVNWEHAHLTSVALFFEKNGVKYELNRTQNPNSLALTEGDEDPRVITQEQVEDLCGFTRNTFLLTVLMGQFNTFFFDLSPAVQLSIFSDALKLEVWTQAAEASRVEAAKAAKEVQSLQVGIGVLEGKIESFIAEIEALKEQSAAFESRRHAKIARLSADLKNFEAADEKFRKAYDVAKQHATELQEQFGSVETAFIAQDRKREAGEKQLIGLQGKLSSLAAKRAGLAKEFEKLDRSGTICPVCGGTLSDKALAKEMKRIEQALEELDVEEAGLSKSVRQTEDEVAGARVAVQKLSDTYTRQRAEIKEAFDISSKRARDCAQNAAELKATRSELAAEEAAKNNFDDMLEAASQRLDVSIKEQEEHKRVIGELQKRLGALEYWAKGFKQVKLWLVEQALTELEIEVNSSLVLLGLQDWRIRFDVERETTSGTTSKGFTIFIESPLSGEQSVPWEAWSGGETQRLRIAGAIGLASLIRSRQGCECNLEIWDEPTAHLSEEGITDLLTFFETRARSLQRQIWLVDHRSLNAGNFDHEVTVVKTVQGSQIKQA